DPVGPAVVCGVGRPDRRDEGQRGLGRRGGTGDGEEAAVLDLDFVSDRVRQGVQAHRAVGAVPSSSAWRSSGRENSGCDSRSSRRLARAPSRSPASRRWRMRSIQTSAARSASSAGGRSTTVTLVRAAASSAPTRGAGGGAALARRSILEACSTALRCAASCRAASCAAAAVDGADAPVGTGGAGGAGGGAGGAGEGTGTDNGATGAGRATAGDSRAGGSIAGG